MSDIWDDLVSQVTEGGASVGGVEIPSVRSIGEGVDTIMRGGDLTDALAVTFPTATVESENRVTALPGLDIVSDVSDVMEGRENTGPTTRLEPERRGRVVSRSDDGVVYDPGARVVGPDMRPNAAALGAFRGMTFDWGDELAESLGADPARIEQMRRQMALAQEQAPGETALGAIAGSLPASLAGYTAASRGIAGLAGAARGALGMAPAAEAATAAAPSFMRAASTAVPLSMAEGAVQRAGASEEGSRLQDALNPVGLATDAVIGAGAEVVGPAVRGVSRRIRTAEREVAHNALSDVGIHVDGRLRSEGRLPSTPAGQLQMARHIEALRTPEGAALGPVSNRANRSDAREAISRARADVNQSLNRIEERIADTPRAMFGDAGAVSVLERELEAYARSGALRDAMATLAPGVRNVRAVLDSAASRLRGFRERAREATTDEQRRRIAAEAWRFINERRRGLGADLRNIEGAPTLSEQVDDDIYHMFGGAQQRAADRVSEETGRQFRQDFDELWAYHIFERGPLRTGGRGGRTALQRDLRGGESVSANQNEGVTLTQMINRGAGRAVRALGSPARRMARPSASEAELYAGLRGRAQQIPNPFPDIEFFNDLPGQVQQLLATGRTPARRAALLHSLQRSDPQLRAQIANAQAQETVDENQDSLDMLEGEGADSFDRDQAAGVADQEYRLDERLPDDERQFGNTERGYFEDMQTSEELDELNRMADFLESQY